MLIIFLCFFFFFLSSYFCCPSFLFFSFSFFCFLFHSKKVSFHLSLLIGPSFGVCIKTFFLCCNMGCHGGFMCGCICLAFFFFFSHTSFFSRHMCLIFHFLSCLLCFNITLTLFMFLF